MNSRFHLDEATAVRLAALAETVDESLDLLLGRVRPVQSGADTSALRLQAWQEAMEVDERGALGRILARERLGLDALHDRLKQSTGLHPQASWIHSLEPALVSIAQHGTPVDQVSSDQVAFEAVFDGLVTALRQKKQPQWEDQLARSGIKAFPDAFDHLFEYLSKRLAHYLGPTLFAAFATEKQEWPQAPEPGDTHRYHDFVERARTSGLHELILDRPVLGRMLVNIVDLFESSNDRFFADFSNDIHRLKTLVNGSLAELVDLSCGHSDPHEGGRSVVFLGFASGAKLVYKPRGLALDRHWQELVTWAASVGLPSPGVAPFVDCGRHGWQAWVEQAPSATEAEVHRYFEKCGVALALLQIAGANDIHQENVIAVADTPFFIDLETLVAGATVKEDTRCNPAARKAASVVADTVWNSLLLPRFTQDPGGSRRRTGGLAPADTDDAMGWQFTLPNTDQMDFEQAPTPAARRFNLPVMLGVEVNPGDHVDRIIHGYTQTMEVLRDDAPAPAASLTALESTAHRCLARPTGTYGEMINLLRDPATQLNGVMWSARLEFEYEGVAPAGLLDDIGLIRAERRSMVRLDVPRFERAGVNQPLYDSDGVVYRAQERELTPSERWVALARRSDDAMDIRLIRFAFRGLEEEPVPDTAGAEETLKSRRVSDAQVDISNSVLKASAQAQVAQIVQIVKDRAVVSQGMATWCDFEARPDGGAEYKPMSMTLYGGIAGITVFLAAASQFLKDLEAADLTAKSLRAIAWEADAANDAVARRELTVGSRGLTVYALTVVNGFLNDETSLQAARSLASGLDWEAMQLLGGEQELRNEHIDLLDGACGVIVGLTHLWRATQEREWLDKACRLADRLCDLADTTQVARIWPITSEQPAYIGLAHGAAGMLLALEQLERALISTALSDRCARHRSVIHALRAILERTYDPARDDWPSELREIESDGPCMEDDGVYLGRWCHGRAGIGWAETHGVGATAPRGMAGAMRSAVKPLDLLCCGNFGVLDWLVGSSAKYAEATSGAAEIANEVLRQLQQTGHYRLSLDSHELSFFRGLTGVGYAWLRVLDPQKFPSVLGFQTFNKANGRE